LKYDLIAIDIDGTLINEQQKITTPVFEAVRKVVQSGSQIVLCTGRPFPGAEDYMKELELNQKGDFIINYHGALVQRTDTGEVVIDHQLDADDLHKWYDFAQKYNSNFQGVRNDGVYTDQTDFNFEGLIEPFYNQMPLHIRPLEELTEHSYSKFIMSDAEDIVQNLEDHVPVAFREDYTVLRSQAMSLEVLNKNASKGQSLKELADHLEIPRERVMAIGDSGNDIDMVDYAGLGVAMDNAVPAVKNVADVITGSNEKNGVATAIDRYLFSE